MREATEETRDAFLDRMAGRVEKVLIETTRTPLGYEGCTPNYTPVLVDCGPECCGRIVPVRITGRADKGLLMLRVRNAYTGERQQAADGLFATTKADRRAHGLGLRGMREIAARYGGTLETTAQDGVFELIACRLPLHPPRKDTLCTLSPSRSNEIFIGQTPCGL